MATRSTGGRNPAWRGDFRQEKGPGDYPGPSVWWRRGESNPRPKMIDPRYYMLVLLIGLTGGNSTDKAHRAASLLCSRPSATGMPPDHPVIVTLHPRARAQAGSGLGLKRPERRRRRWRLKFCHQINEVGDDLGMHQAMSQSPSKPVAPVNGRCRPTSMGALEWARKGGRREARGLAVAVQAQHAADLTPACCARA